MTFPIRLTAFAALHIALAPGVMAAPALAKDAEPYNAADAARKYSAAPTSAIAKRADRRHRSLDCLKEHVKRLTPRAARRFRRFDGKTSGGRRRQSIELRFDALNYAVPIAGLFLPE